VRIKRYLVLVTVLVFMGLATVWWKSRTVAMGYEAVRLRRDLSRAAEEQRLEDCEIARMTAPARVKSEAARRGLALKLMNTRVARPENRRGDDDGRSARLAER